MRDSLSLEAPGPVFDEGKQGDGGLLSQSMSLSAMNLSDASGTLAGEVWRVRFRLELWRSHCNTSLDAPCLLHSVSPGGLSNSE